jgi:hypothetical protein
MFSTDFKKGFAIGLGVFAAVVVVGFAGGVLKRA